MVVVVVVVVVELVVAVVAVVVAVIVAVAVADVTPRWRNDSCRNKWLTLFRQCFGNNVYFLFPILIFFFLILAVDVAVDVFQFICQSSSGGIRASKTTWRRIWGRWWAPTRKCDISCTQTNTSTLNAIFCFFWDGFNLFFGLFLFCKSWFRKKSLWLCVWRLVSRTEFWLWRGKKI